MIFYIIWLCIGLIAVSPLLIYANQFNLHAQQKILGRSLIIAAMIYVSFALAWGDFNWVMIELIGIPLYGLFYWLAIRYGSIWLAIGWLMHPLWDVLLHLMGPGFDMVPAQYAIACISFDIAVAVFIVARMKR